MAGGKFPVTPSVDLAEFKYFNHLKRKDFDEFPITELREECLRQLNEDHGFDWLRERVEAYLEINDFKTVFMLLRKIANYHGDKEHEVFELMAKTAKNILDLSRYQMSYLRDAIAILCNKIHHSDGFVFYNSNIKVVFEKIIEKHYPSVYGNSEEEARLVSIVLLSIGHMKDGYFLPILESKEISEKELFYLMKYTSVSKERIKLEGLRILVIRQLKP